MTRTNSGRNRVSRKPGSEAQPESDLQDIAGSEAVASPDMNRDPLAGAMDSGSMQDDTIEDAEEDDTGQSARNDPAPPGGPASRNTSAPAGDEVGTDEPSER